MPDFGVHTLLAAQTPMKVVLVCMFHGRGMLPCIQVSCGNHVLTSTKLSTFVVQRKKKLWRWGGKRYFSQVREEFFPFLHPSLPTLNFTLASALEFPTCETTTARHLTHARYFNHARTTIPSGLPTKSGCEPFTANIKREYGDTEPACEKRQSPIQRVVRTRAVLVAERADYLLQVRKLWFGA